MLKIIVIYIFISAGLFTGGIASHIIYQKLTHQDPTNLNATISAQTTQATEKEKIISLDKASTIQLTTEIQKLTNSLIDSDKQNAQLMATIQKQQDTLSAALLPNNTASVENTSKSSVTTKVDNDPFPSLPDTSSCPKSQDGPPGSISITAMKCVADKEVAYSQAKEAWYARHGQGLNVYVNPTH